MPKPKQPVLETKQPAKVEMSEQEKRCVPVLKKYYKL